MNRKTIVIRVWLICTAAMLAALLPSRSYQFWKAPSVVRAARAECVRRGLGEVWKVDGIYQGPSWVFTYSSEIKNHPLMPHEVEVMFNGKALVLRHSGK